MRTIKRLLAAGLSVATLASVPAFAAETDGLEHFQPVAAYSDELFTDLDPNGWYMENVETAYELGLMKGVGSGSFSPDGTISLGETIALAARVHSIYETGAASFTQGSPWYQVYVDYAARNGIFTGSAATDYGAPATRSQFAAVLANALPEEALEPINTVDDGMIPDVPEGAANYDAIYLLYRAGVLTGSDGRGTYNPQTTIGRSSVAALVTRMVRPELRQSITLADPDKEVSVTLNRTSLSLTEGDSQKLTATVRPSDAADKDVAWSSSNTAVATVSSSGTVTAVGEGSATITARTANGVSASCTVTVTAEEQNEEAEAPSGETYVLWDTSSRKKQIYNGIVGGWILLDYSEHSLKVDAEWVKGAEPAEIIWTSSDPSVLEIVRQETEVYSTSSSYLPNSEGITSRIYLIGRSPGTATISAEIAQDPSTHLETTITVRGSESSMTLDPSSPLTWETSVSRYDETRPGIITVRDVTVEKLPDEPDEQGYAVRDDTYRISYTVDTENCGFDESRIDIEYKSGSPLSDYGKQVEPIDDGAPYTYTVRCSVLVDIYKLQQGTFSFVFD